MEINKKLFDGLLCAVQSEDEREFVALLPKNDETLEWTCEYYPLLMVEAVKNHQRNTILKLLYEKKAYPDLKFIEMLLLFETKSEAVKQFFEQEGVVSKNLLLKAGVYHQDSDWIFKYRDYVDVLDLKALVISLLEKDRIDLLKLLLLR